MFRFCLRRLSAPCRAARRFAKDDRGAIAFEYAIMVALIIITCLGSIRFMGGTNDGVWGKNTSELETQVWSNL